MSLTRLGRTALHCHSEITIGISCIHLLKREEVVAESKKHAKNRNALNHLLRLQLTLLVLTDVGHPDLLTELRENSAKKTNSS